MRPGSILASAALLALCLGASCDDGAGDGPRPATRPTGGGEVPVVPGVNLARLTDAERGVFAAILSEQLSPCGDPVPLSRCAAEPQSCSACPRAARFVARLVTEGYEREEIAEMYRTRYGADGEVAIPIGDAPVRGAPMAQVTVVEFSDFQCGHCAATDPILRRLLEQFDGRLRLVYMHFPLSSHPQAVPAAIASIAAGKQGRFWDMHDALFENQSELSASTIVALAQRLGLDMARFQRDVDDEATRRQVDANKAVGRAAGVDSTPSFFVNGRAFGEHPRSLADYIREEMD